MKRTITHYELIRKLGTGGSGVVYLANDTQLMRPVVLKILKRGALTTGMDRGIHPAKLKRLGRHKSFDLLGEYLEFGDLFDGHPLTGVL